MIELTLPLLKAEAQVFVQALSTTTVPALYGTNDGKTVGTFVEHGFRKHLQQHYTFSPGNSASGIDFAELGVDLKVTSIRQPQSSCPFRSASQKVYGLGYHLLLIVYEKFDDAQQRTARIEVRSVVFISRGQTGDYQTTSGLRDILSRNGNKDDVVAFLEERNLPLDEIGRELLADRILQQPPEPGYLTEAWS